MCLIGILRKLRTINASSDELTGPGGEYTSCTTAIRIPLRFKKATEVLNLLEEQVTAVRETDVVGMIEKARASDYFLTPLRSCSRSDPMPNALR